jgi:FkbM family methyltransferase
VNLPHKFIKVFRYLYSNFSQSKFAPFLIISERLSKNIKKSYSSHGEDLVIDGILKRHFFISGKSLTFSYIDLGAWRPIRGSNTYHFYKMGLRGTVVEPNSKLNNLWKLIRPEDQLINFACDTKDKAIFYEFNSIAASNTSDKNFKNYIKESQKLNEPNQIEVQALSLDKIIEIHLEKFSGPFILDIDIEGSDELVIKQYDFINRQRPLIIVIEDHFLEGISQSPITRYLKENNFGLIGRCQITSIFIDLQSELKLSQILI